MGPIKRKVVNRKVVNRAIEKWLIEQSQISEEFGNEIAFARMDYVEAGLVFRSCLSPRI